MQHTNIPTFCFEKISLDVVGKLLTTSKGDSYLLTVFDLFSSYHEAIPIPDKSAETIANVLIRYISHFIFYTAIYINGQWIVEC